MNDKSRTSTDTARTEELQYDITCSCGWEKSVSAYGQAEREGMKHSDECMNCDIKITDCDTGEVIYRV